MVGYNNKVINTMNQWQARTEIHLASRCTIQYMMHEAKESHDKITWGSHDKTVIIMTLKKINKWKPEQKSYNTHSRVHCLFSVV